MTASEPEPLPVTPMGVFAPTRSNSMPATADALRPLIGGTPRELRSRVTEYLRAGTHVVPLMEYTRDVLDDRFGVSGGSALLTDGTFYWRSDTADYVEEYGITVPDEVLDHMRVQQWRPPVLDQDIELRIHQYLWDELGAHGKDEAPRSSIRVFSASSDKGRPASD